MNAQGDVIALLDENYNVVVKYTYDTWGKVLSVTNASGTLITDTTHIGHRNPIRYRGYYYDVETGLYYLQSRYYDPEVGRFINADGIMAGIGGNDNGYNLFAYCFNNPVNLIDSEGNWPKWMKYVAAAAGIIVGSGTIPVLASVAASTISVHIVECTVINYVVTEVIYDMPNKEEHYGRNEKNYDFPDHIDGLNNDEDGWIVGVSANCHQFSAPNRDNKKIVSSDGDHEAIYDRYGYLVTDPRDIGTYNFISPTEDGFGHFIEDVLPWFIHGNSESDSTNAVQRIAGFFHIYI